MSYYNYEDYKSEEEEIVDEAVSQITELIREKAKQELNAVQYRLDYYKEQTELLEKARANACKERDAVQKELEEYKKQVDNANNVVKSLPFNIDDECWIIVTDGADEEQCPVCGGTRKIDSYHPDYGVLKAECPYCGTYFTYSNQKFTTFKYRAKRCFVNKIFANIEKEKVTYKFQIRSERDDVSNIDSIYRTKEEAEAEIQKMLEEQNKKHEAWLKGAENCKIPKLKQEEAKNEPLRAD